ncbi:MAG: ERF family protein [Xenococcaceae cyanobacterium MO_188.B19]|nr:ERF family protein [Xenococcaceae cyanobacterium MO_188.B19]
MKAELFKKLLSVQKNLKPVAESGKNTFQKYKYATSIDVLEPVKKTCNEFGLFIYLDVVDSQIEPGRATCKICLTVVDCDSGESVSIAAFGHAEDWSHKENRPTGDKAIYKAITGATKYAVRAMFVLPSSDDPENSRDSNNYSSAKKQSTVYRPSPKTFNQPKPKTNSVPVSATQQSQTTKSDKPYSHWKNDGDAIDWARTQLPHINPEEIRREWSKITPVTLSNNKSSKAIPWVERIQQLKTISSGLSPVHN